MLGGVADRLAGCNNDDRRCVAQAEAPTEAIKPGDIVTNPDLARMRERQRRIETLSALFARQNRVYRIGYRLLYAAVDMCPDRLRVATGFTYANAYMFQGPVRTAASAMGYTHRVSVVDVAPNGGRGKGRHPGARPVHEKRRLAGALR
ncbi:MAG: hypothetical protein VCC99_00410, partial [Alphaproteobacteria bacterium]